MKEHISEKISDREHLKLSVKELLMHNRLNNGLKFSLIGNILFIAFGIVCFIYFKTFDGNSIISNIIAFIAYTVEISGFALLLFGDWLIATAIRSRGLFKTAWTAYIAIEAVMMVLELNYYNIDFYKPYSLTLAIIHSVISGFICLTFLQLENDNKKLELRVFICILIIFAGMLGNILGIRIYFSIITNAVAFIVMFQSLRSLVKRSDIEIDCHGDRARVAEYKSTFVDD